eukprot:2487656-Prorocentrum_lima.AAC.1
MSKSVCAPRMVMCCSHYAATREMLVCSPDVRAARPARLRSLRGGQLRFDCWAEDVSDGCCEQSAHGVGQL